MARISRAGQNLNAWFGRKKELRRIIEGLRLDLAGLTSQPDDLDLDVKQGGSEAVESKDKAGLRANVPQSGLGLDVSAERMLKSSTDVELRYRHNENKLRELNHRLPGYKEKIREFFSLTTGIKAVFIQIDDYYHLNQTDQPYVADYVHRLCKDTPLKFKIATLKHNSVLYIERNKQPIGIQERHDYQPINIDFTFEQFDRTKEQNLGIFHEFAQRSGISASDFDSLFKGAGFDRLILAGGGVPRDCLSFFLKVLDNVRKAGQDEKIGKDDVRFLSRQTFESRINELKQDSEGQDQESLLRGIYAIRSFCLERKTNVFLVAESEIQADDEFKTLLYRLLDYRMIHQVAKSLTHKSFTGANYQAFAIDIGCYAYMRNLQGRLEEIDLTLPGAKERMRSSPVIDAKEFRTLWTLPAGKSAELALVEQEKDA